MKKRKYFTYSERQMVQFFYYPLLVFMKNIFSPKFGVPHPNNKVDPKYEDNLRSKDNTKNGKEK